MRLAVVTPQLTERAGQGRVNVEILRRWLDRGHSATGLTRDVAPVLLEYERFTQIDLRDDRVPTMLLKNRVLAMRSARYLSRHRDDFDVIVNNGTATLAPTDANLAHFVFGAFASAKPAFAKQRVTPRTLYYSAIEIVGIREERTAFRRARTAVAVSAGVRDQLIRIGVPADKVAVIWNGIDVDEFAPGHESRAELGLPAGPLAFFAGDLTFSGRKNLDTVLAALQLLPDIRLAVAGKVAGSAYPQLAEKLGVADRVSFLGFRDDIARLMRAVDVFVYPAIYEPLGLVVLEALASGIPVVTAKTTGAAALMDDTVGRVLDDPLDSAGIAAAMRAYIDDAELRERTGRSARALACEYTWTRMADAYVDLFEGLARSRGATT